MLRTKLDGNPTFRELLSRVRETALGAYAHQDVPFEKLVEELRPERDLSRTPLFQVMFTLQNTPRQELSLPGLTLRGVEAGNEVAKFDLTLSVSERPDGLMAGLSYNTDLFEEATAARMLSHLRVLLEGLTGDPAQRLSELPLLSGTERHQLLVAWNDTAAPCPPDLFVHEQVAARAGAAPDSLAVASAEERLTYAELDRRANRLAQHLRALGVGPETRVGVLLERSVDMVTSLLATLKAGGAYVPLDTAYPRERLRYMLEDSAARVLLTRTGLAQRHSLVSTDGMTVVCLDTDAEHIARRPDSAPGAAATADTLAYVIYTSGSTGRPKGVQISHGSLANLVAWHQRTYALTPRDRGTQLAGTAFDASVWELWPYLATGAGIHLPTEEVRTSPEALVQWLTTEGITVSFLPTPLAEAVLEVNWPERSALRALLTGGDRLRRRPRPGTGFRLVNHYGPTESTVVTTCAEVSVQAEAGLPPIGRPIANTEVYVLDASLRPVPVGVAGELCIGGRGLARGYLGQPALTAERFIPHPFSTTPGARLYRTGDVVRYLPDGSLEYVGRQDEQVKVRGFRIELGEIEWALAQFPRVQEAVVLAREDVPGDKRLVAYVAATEPLDTAALRTFLRERLPEYMVPSAFVTLEVLPLTPNGKVDRKALPAPDSAPSQTEHIAPRTPTEELLAGIWSRLLGARQVGVTDSFFELGGHSLLATQAVNRIRAAFGVELPLRALFEAPTVAALASRVDFAVRTGRGMQVPALVPVARDGRPLPLSFAQQRLWFLDQLTPHSPLYNIPMAVRFQGALDVPALEQAFSALTERHESLRTTFGLVGEEPIQVISPALAVPLAVVDLGSVPDAQRESELRRLATEESLRSFDLARGPLFRATLLRLSAQDHVLLLTVHHIVSDGWSTGVLIRELAALYQGFTSGQPSTLPALPVQYADYAAWQRGWLRGAPLEAQLAYWRQHLSGAPRALELPTDKPRPAVQSHRGASETARISKELAEALKALGQREGATPFMVLMATWQVLLARYSGQDDISVGSPIAGRTQGETEGLIGFFVNTL
ncbi:amino acid adenylation domain-containing protein, partial [Archangium sp.]|uniref:amino acid adenylation domain-containing protein n=1 Tax=Archangium sp. TaxID=1872627 RepID=UPI00389B2D77